MKEKEVFKNNPHRPTSPKEAQPTAIHYAKFTNKKGLCEVSSGHEAPHIFRLLT